MPARVLDLVAGLCRALEAERVDYCHWKSNAALDRSASGENDLDLLIRRRHAEVFAAVLHRLGFKEARLPPARALPGVRDFYGWDPAANKWVHVHAHYQLILGHDATKNYRLPVEEAYLSSSSQGELFRVPAPEWELVVLVVRLMLKHAPWDSLLGFEASLSRSERNEFEYLEARADPLALRAIVEGHLPYLGFATFDACRASLRPGASFVRRLLAGRRMLRALAAHGRRPAAGDALMRVVNRGRFGLQRYVLRRRTRRVLASGGAIVAVVGGDGSGKSTVVNALLDWLSPTFHVKRTHLGKPPLSAFGFVAKVAIKATKLAAGGREAQSHVPAPGAAPGFPGYLRLAWHVLTARDRLRAYVAARRFATGGGIVISDRFPLASIRSMDGPKAAIALATRQGSIVKWLVREEERCYDHVRPPDVTIVLRVPPEIAVERRSHEDAAWIRARAQEIFDIDWGGTGADVIDAGQPLEEVLLQVRTLVWSRL